jgi:Sulfocyanin (SoxE) domain
MKLKHIIPLVAVTLAACGGGESGGGGASGSASSSTPAARPPAVKPAPTGPMTMPDWYTVDSSARTVHMDITAGLTPDNNHWNFKGATNGDLAITVPEGYRVDIKFTNADPNMAHSIGVSAETSNFAVPPTPTPVFAGAISKNPGSMIDGTMPGQTETIAFVADKAGQYSLVCYVPGHTAVGMWLHFNVVAGGDAGVQTR